MNLNFKVLRDNKDGTLLIEYPIYHTGTISIPNGISGNALAGADLAYYINRQVDLLQTVDEPLDASGFQFHKKQGWNAIDFNEKSPNLTEVGEEISNFPMNYNG